MTIAFLKEYTQRIPADSVLRQQFDRAMKEIEALEAVVPPKTNISEEKGNKGK